MLKTWKTFHAAAFAHDLPHMPPFPLSPMSIRRVGALFRAERYASYDNYSSRARAEHLSLGAQAGGSWTVEIEVAFRNTARAVNRGAANPRQSRPLDPVRVAALQLDDDPLVAGGPIAPGDFATVGVFFLLRRQPDVLVPLLRQQQPQTTNTGAT